MDCAKKILMTAVCWGVSALLTVCLGVQVGPYASHTTNANVVTFSTGGTQKVRITVCTPTIVRVEFDPRGMLVDTLDLLDADFMTKDWSPLPPITVTDQGTAIEVSTGKLVVQAQKSPFRLKFLELPGRTVLTGEDDARGMAVGASENPWLQLTQRSDEHYFGWGEAYNWYKHGLRSCDKKGKASITGRGMEAPFMYSTGGYGIFILLSTKAPNFSTGLFQPGPLYDLTGSYAKFRPSASGQEQIYPAGTVTANIPNMLGYYFIAGPGGSSSKDNWREVIDGYTQVSGRPQLLGKKFYGIHRDIYLFGGVSAAGMKDIVDRWRTGRFPIDVVRNDEYFDWGKIGYTTPPNTSGWNADVPGAIAYYKQKGMVFGGMVKGWGIDGCCGGRNNDVPIEDSAHAKTAVDHGFDYAWYDAMTYISRRRAQQMFNIWKYAHGGDASKVWTAKGWFSLCSQSFAAGHTGDYLDNPTYAVIPGHLEQSLAGYPVSYTDLGEGHDWNYIGTSMRPLASYHGAGSAGGYAGGTFKVYEYPAAMQDLIRKWSRNHYRFIPYFFTYGMIAHETGMPIWRHMVCHDPHNADTYNKDRQAYVGDNLIISPYYGDGDGNSGSRNGIYLPPGAWYDYFEGTAYTGPTTINYRVDPGTGLLNCKLPMFVRAGAIIPLMDTLQFVGEKPETLITVQAWPAGTSRFTLYEDETPVKTLLTCAQSGSQTDLTVGPFAGSKYCPDASKRRYVIELHGSTPPQSVISGTTALTQQSSKTAFNAASSGWFFDAAQGGVTYAKPNGDARAGFTVSFCQTGQCSPVFTDDAGAFQPAGHIRLAAGLRRIDVPHAGAYRIEVCNTAGQVVATLGGTGPARASIPALAKGLYLVKIATVQGAQVLHVVLR